MTADNCQHHRVDNVTGCCEACGEQMVAATTETVFVASAPNLAAGSGQYVPDVARQRLVPVGVDTTYECARCRHQGNYVADGKQVVVPSCGNVHRGARTRW